MGHKWKGTVEARKLRFLELYEDGASYQEIMTQLGLDEHDLRDWRATIRILGVSRFLMSHTVKTTYSYETKLAAVKARIEDQVSYQDILVAYGVAPKLLRRWCKIYSEHGEAGLQPKKRGRQLGAKQKPVQELTRECQDFCVWGGYSRGSPTRLPFVFEMQYARPDAIAGAKVEGPARSAGGSSLAPAIARREAAGALAREV